jgi:hypothetical protein
MPFDRPDLSVMPGSPREPDMMVPVDGVKPSEEPDMMVPVDGIKPSLNRRGLNFSRLLFKSAGLGRLIVGIFFGMIVFEPHDTVFFGLFGSFGLLPILRFFKGAALHGHHFPSGPRIRLVPPAGFPRTIILYVKDTGKR